MWYLIAVEVKERTRSILQKQQVVVSHATTDEWVPSEEATPGSGAASFSTLPFPAKHLLLSEQLL